MRRLGQFLSCAILFLSMGTLTESFGQDQPQSETRTGCIINGKTTGTFVLVDEVTGQQLPVTGTNLSRYTEGGGSQVVLTGRLTTQGASQVFEVTRVEQTRNICAPFAFSPESQKFELGKARIGFRAGLGLDPELVIVGGQAQLGPVLKSIWLRPTAEFAFGEVTKVFSINGDVVYYLPFAGVGRSQGSRWNTYVGGGPAFTILRRDFEGFPNQPVDVDNDWDTEVGLNFVFGVTQNNGLFIELRAGAYNTPAVRLYMGYVFR
jgi:hypothetical protein